MTATPNKIPPLVWVVDSEYTGELHARIGLAERLGYGYELIPIPDGDTQRYQKNLQTRYRQQGENQPPLLVISGTGEETTAEIADLRELFNGQLFNVYLASILPDERHPRLAEYDLVASPQLSGGNIVTIPGVPHQLTREGLAAAYQQYENYFNALPKPIIALLVGGNTRYCNGFTEDHARQFAGRVYKISTTLGGCVLVSNSRRTPPDALTALLTGLAGLTHYFFDWQQIESHFYHALLAHADVFVVSGDSLSMCSEAAFTGKPLLVDLSSSATECYHRDIVGRLIDYGAARLLTDKFEPWSYIPPDPTGKLVDVIQKHFGNICQS
ncbi:MAG: ELM1/GtrOC1 family putative glycosyltransferase [Methylovulum sp.]|uniref:ELM1/GtrOC1 family putative glycosyltransferase n=1 Tax=Methylovulum sp. TaxID=1916980 RepID=UPI002633E12E|nr:ELM1/GtrOC1 family putative glycosyltransferase [Methylovulum sp.]MDD2724960.1 ELM1/GtrOC1 family putative glycosyltransferase [Methylovulum sp.]MDD5123516.1 ELM1/GtrOC1 family putative glycosyltransferase [Methylovulum sp.]